MEDNANSVHGRLMQNEDGDVEHKPEQNGGKKKAGKLPDFKIDIVIRRHSVREGAASSKQYRTDLGKCCVILLVFCLLVLLVTAVALLSIYLGGPRAEVSTSVGAIAGLVTDFPTGHQVEEYLGIPFAHPPVGRLRFADPVPLKKLPTKYQGPYRATRLKNSCMQFLDTTYGEFAGSHMWNSPTPLSEDCLYLNVWVPRQKTDKKRAVMVWIYGGGFYSGSNALWVYDGKALAAHGDVIVASFNYRVDSFGYLSTGDGRIKGNFGMKDQVAALQWIHDNIAAFGGDPDLITVFGESSGATSAGLHMMSNHSSHLFRRAIFESGAPDAHWGFMTQQQARHRSSRFLEQLSCTNETAAAVLSCLRAKDASEILHQGALSMKFMEFTWAPTVDGDFLTDTPHNLLRAGAFVRKEAILGANSEEGTFWISYWIDALTKDGPSPLTYDQFRSGVDVVDWDLDASQRQQVLDLYTEHEIGDPANGEANRDALDKVCGDRSFYCPTVALTELFTGRGLTTYFYYLTYRASTETWPDWMGVIHGAEIQWIFGMPLNASRGYTPEEVHFSKVIMGYWANFARTGDPNGPGLPYWPSFLIDHGKYIEWRGPHEFYHRTQLRRHFCDFWQGVHEAANGVTEEDTVISYQ